MTIKTAYFLILMLLFPAIAAYAEGDQQLFQNRRDRLSGELGGGAAIFQNSPVYPRNGDVDYVYRTDSDFYYLTGCDLPDAVMVLTPENETSYVLFIDAPSPMAAIWGSGGYTLAEAQSVFAADTVFDLDDLEEKLPDLIGRRETLFYDFRSKNTDELIHKAAARRWGPRPHTYRDLLPLVHELRKIKSPEEIALMRHAIEATCAGLNESMRTVEADMFEYEVKAILEYVFRINQCSFDGFPSIVASGPNATIMHYESYNRKLLDGDLLLMDVGAEYNYYGADITRTFPVSGKFTRHQAEIYQLVLDAQTAAMDSMVPGVPAYHCHNAAEAVIKQGLYRLELITDPGTAWQHYLYYYAYINHSLGMDVHDPGDFGPSRTGGAPLEPGMVMTIEPALYFGDRWIESFRRSAPRRFNVGSDSVDIFLKKIMPVYEKYRGIGIRIEDDMLVTPEGNEILSKSTPREITEIEELMDEPSVYFIND